MEWILALIAGYFLGSCDTSRGCLKGCLSGCGCMILLGIAVAILVVTCSHL